MSANKSVDMDLRKEFTILVSKNLIKHDEEKEGIFSLYSWYKLAKYLEKHQIIPDYYYKHIHRITPKTITVDIPKRCDFPELKYDYYSNCDFYYNENYKKTIQEILNSSLLEFNKGINHWSCLCSGCMNTILESENHCKQELLSEGLKLRSSELSSQILDMLKALDTITDYVERLVQIVEIFRVCHTNKKHISEYQSLCVAMRKKLEQLYDEGEGQTGVYKLASIMADIFLNAMRDVLYTV